MKRLICNLLGPGRFQKRGTRVLFAIFAVCFCSSVWAASYFVDSRTGNDQNDGLSAASAWKSIEKVNAAEIQPGDKVLFARGGLWRGVVRPHSGTEGNPVYYGAFGAETLPAPTFYGSVEASSPEDWTEVEPGLWATKEVAPVVGKEFNQKQIGELKVQGDNSWGKHNENGAKASAKTVGSGFSLSCEKTGTATNHIQIWGPSVDSNIPDSGLMVTFRARCSKPYKMPQITVQNSSSPWNGWFSASGTVDLTSDWQTFSFFLNRVRPNEQPAGETLRYHLALGGIPEGATLDFELIEAREASIDRSKLLFCDVGNIIFNHGKYTKLHRCGIKKWSKDDCKAPGDYWYNAQNRRVYLRFDGNPGQELDSIELALRATMFDQGGKSDIVYENLALAYGAAHGFGGGSTKRITIRSCDIYYIGGGHQFTHPNGRPVRFGNGIEFWGNCDQNLVEKCRLWEIYDAALTNQGREDSETNVIYRKNLIWNSEYSFEYWNAKYTDNILFEDNVCLDSGFGWAHDQRPDPNGAHLMFYQNKAQTKNFVVRNNVFSNSTEVCIRMENDWRDGLTLEGNKYYQAEKPLLRWHGSKYYPKGSLKQMAEELGMEKTGVELDRPFQTNRVPQ